jgi:hypothetical protein
MHRQQYLGQARCREQEFTVISEWDLLKNGADFWKTL